MHVIMHKREKAMNGAGKANLRDPSGWFGAGRAACVISTSTISQSATLWGPPLASVER